MMRAGDEIVKQQVEYKDPGRSGENVLWDFGKLKTQNDEYKLTYSGRNGKIAGTEHRTMYYYSLSGDSLFCHGFENPTTLMTDERPELLMKFPVKYGDSTFCCYNGNGRYCDRLKIGAMGTVTGKADAYGMMILPDGDTLKNVIRVHTVKTIAENTGPLFYHDLADPVKTYVTDDSINYRLANDTVLLGVETYRWYVKGYRYPVFETVKSITDRHGEERTFFDTAFYYPPQEHYYLENDPENLALLKEDADAETGGPQNTGPWAGLTYNFYPNPAVTNLEVEMYLPRTAHVRMQLTNRPGQVVWSRDFGIWREGINTAQIFVSPFPTGEYVLNMWVEDYMIGEIIMKK